MNVDKFRAALSNFLLHLLNTELFLIKNVFYISCVSNDKCTLKWKITTSRNNLNYNKNDKKTYT